MFVNGNVIHQVRGLARCINYEGLAVAEARIAGSQASDGNYFN